MKLQGYIQYYLHCDFYLTVFEKRTRITNYWPAQDQNEVVIGYGLDDHNGVCGIEEIKPILRKLEDMTDEDKTEIGRVMEWYKGHDLVGVKHMETMHDTYKNMASDCLIKANSNFDDRLGPSAYFKMLPALTKLGFDLFGLIDTGLAIDSKTLK